MSTGDIHKSNGQGKYTRSKIIQLLLVSFLFGTLALTIVLIQFSLPIPGTNIITDPREIFVSVGAALTGPLGALVIGCLAGAGESGDISASASILGHVCSGLWIALSYKHLIFRYLKMPALLLGWMGSILVYYIFLFGIPSIWFALTSPSYLQDYPIEFYVDLINGLLLELLVTLTVSTLVLIALPQQYRKPLW